MEFIEKLKAIWEKNNSLLCIGLDPDIDKLPLGVKSNSTPLFTFNRAIIDATHDLVCAYKPNSAFYEATGADGIRELKMTCDYIKVTYPTIPIILDFKRGDIGNTNTKYAEFAFNYLGVDAITVQPYQGKEAIQSFLDYKDKGIIVLDKMSNQGAGEFQDLVVDGVKLYIKVAKQINENWNQNGNCLLVVGATYPNEIAEIRQLVGDDMIFLVPGLGAQGGSAEETISGGLNSKGTGLIVNSSRAILFASSEDNFADISREKAVETRDELNSYRGVRQ